MIKLKQLFDLDAFVWKKAKIDFKFVVWLAN